MRVFVTGASGFIGSAVVDELLRAGHDVLALVRTDAAAQRLAAAGARVHRGTIDDDDGLRRAASTANGAVHLAFFHAFGDARLSARLRALFGGSPRGIVTRFLTHALATDRRAIETIGQALRGSDRAFVAAFATMALPQGTLASEDDPSDPHAPGGPRGANETALARLTSLGVRASVLRLPPTVHGTGDHGFLARVHAIAKKHGTSAYVGDGRNRWPAVHRLDAANLVRLALEQGPGGARYHAVAEEGIPFRTIAEVIGHHLDVPIVSATPPDAAKRFSWLGPFIAADNPVSSALTRERLGWQPTHPTLLDDIGRASYFAGS